MMRKVEKYLKNDIINTLSKYVLAILRSLNSVHFEIYMYTKGRIVVDAYLLFQHPRQRLRINSYLKGSGCIDTGSSDRQ